MNYLRLIAVGCAIAFIAAVLTFPLGCKLWDGFEDRIKIEQGGI